MASMCALLELVAQAIEEAEATRVLLKELESDTNKCLDPALACRRIAAP